MGEREARGGGGGEGGFMLMRGGTGRALFGSVYLESGKTWLENADDTRKNMNGERNNIAGLSMGIRNIYIWLQNPSKITAVLFR